MIIKLLHQSQQYLFVTMVTQWLIKLEFVHILFCFIYFNQITIGENDNKIITSKLTPFIRNYGYKATKKAKCTRIVPYFVK